MWADFDGSNTFQTRYIRGDKIDQLLGRIDSSDTVAWYLTDHVGSVRHMIDNSGVVQNTIVYDGFGNITSESNASFGDRYKWTGREWDAEAKLQYNRARYYDPALGRWISRDPIGFEAGDSNLYRYVNNQPVMNTDPSGMRGFTVTFNSWVAYLLKDKKYGFAFHTDITAERDQTPPRGEFIQVVKVTTIGILKTGEVDKQTVYVFDRATVVRGLVKKLPDLSARWDTKNKDWVVRYSNAEKVLGFNVATDRKDLPKNGTISTNKETYNKWLKHINAPKKYARGTTKYEYLYVNCKNADAAKLNSKQIFAKIQDKSIVARMKYMIRNSKKEIHELAAEVLHADNWTWPTNTGRRHTVGITFKP
ncbi:MAG: RHS repeat-associated core domain-containing protein [Gemmataceae bacterium]